MPFRFVPLQLNLKFEWRLSRNTSFEKINTLVIFEQDGLAGYGEIAPNIRYGETPDLVNTQLQQLSLEPEGQLPQLFEEQLCNTSMAACVRTGLSNAYMHWWHQVHHTLTHYAEPIPTLFTIPLMDPGAVQHFVHTYALQRFQTLKLKVDAESAYDLTREALRHTDYKPLLVDGNEAWQNPDDLIKWCEKVKKLPIVGVEQPLPAKLKDEIRYTKKYCSLPLIADESCQEHPDWHFLKQSFDVINIKLMKTGGPNKARELQQIAQREGLKTMIGCMVETSVGIYHALSLSQNANIIDLDGFLLIENEPHHVVSENNGSIIVHGFEQLNQLYPQQ